MAQPKYSNTRRLARQRAQPGAAEKVALAACDLDADWPTQPPFHSAGVTVPVGAHSTLRAPPSAAVTQRAACGGGHTARVFSGVGHIALSHTARVPLSGGPVGGLVLDEADSPTPLVMTLKRAPRSWSPAESSLSTSPRSSKSESDFKLSLPRSRQGCCNQGGTYRLTGGPHGNGYMFAGYG